MKELLFIGMTLLLFICAGTPEKKLEKQIIGEWCNPYTYESTGELKGFRFKKGGVCEAINVPSLELKTWEIKDGYLTIKGFDLDGGKREVYETREKIEQLTKDSLCLVTREENPRIAFLYLNTKIIKKKITPQVASKK